MIRLFLCIPWLSLIGGSAFGQISHGTTVVFSVNRQRVIVAADSRELEGGRPNDHACKLTALGNQLLYTHAGLVSDTFAQNKTENWSAADEAERAYSKFQAKNSNSEDAIDELSADWLGRMKIHYTVELLAHKEQVLRTLDGNVLITAVFVGLGKGGQLKGRELQFTFDRAVLENSPLPEIRVTNDAWEFTPNGMTKVIGYGEIIREYFNMKSARVLKEAERWQLELSTRHGEDLDVLNTVHLVEVTERFAPEKQGVGGPIDVAEIFPNTGRRWIHRKPECPKTGAAKK
jgi:hypothetical protein